ncbi:Kelch repeat-containing protein [Crocinitomix catalasitica]|uniref:Kelch repeat-containing protein n=1 Tax=Crocinitomix catalasitica TaxID=184607 RepID=UPI00047FE719|nr:kelch repeat-containing protein [Crocinitomix catalasitica]
MSKIYFLICLFSISTITISQTGWTWTPLADLPIKISNNAVESALIDGEPFVYSFGGIDSTKLGSGITNRSYKYNVSTNNWTAIDPIPFSANNIASAASTVKNKIYIIGGYTVLEDGTEVSSNEVIRYDPSTDTYLENGANIPVPIDDQVQCVWKDSLIYVITGWSNTGNVPNVQIYNPSFDNWSMGTTTPDTYVYKVFGGSGTIIGDTIFYYGGASNGISFPAQKKLRKGIINPSDPTDITWSELEDGPVRKYRSACLTADDMIYWLGGSSISYNYNGIAYDGGEGVDPLTSINRYNTRVGDWYLAESSPYGVMDFRGVAQIGPRSWIIAGGMHVDQEVSAKSYLLSIESVVGLINHPVQNESLKISNNQIMNDGHLMSVEIFGLDGRRIAELDEEERNLPDTGNQMVIIKAKFKTRTILHHKSPLNLE